MAKTIIKLKDGTVIEVNGSAEETERINPVRLNPVRLTHASA